MSGSKTISARPAASSEPPAKKMKVQNGPNFANGELDEDLHSRQIAVYGRESMRRMAAAKVLVLGMKGLGVEVAKNVILAGVKAVTLHDTEVVQLRDLGIQFYLSEEDIGGNRASSCQAKLQELNTAVAVSATTQDLDDAFLASFDVIVATNMRLAESVKINQSCRQQGTAFVRAELHGVFGSVFCDFGNAFTVLDVDGEEPVTGIISGVTQSESSTIVSCVEDERLEFQDGHLVHFTEVEGIPELNDAKQRRIKNVKAHSFELQEPIRGEVAYTRGGLVTQVKEPKQLAFRSLADALADPGEFLLSDFAKLDRSAQLHLGFQALDAFQAEHGRLPAPACEADASAVLAAARKLSTAAGRAELLDEHTLKLLAYNAAGEINPMAAMFGGFIGQEIMKAVSGKFHPLFQWFYFDSIESLPPIEELTPEACAAKGTRYDGQIAVFGANLQQKLQSLQLFLVGAGALGCEFVKNLACMGVATGGTGCVTITDDDVIEKSNLSRQFLFRDWDIGNAKSTAAAKAAQAINPAFRIQALQNRVSPDSEVVFDDAFWSGVDVVINALDNVTARLYVDSRCVYFGRPLLESGTLGAKANTQVVVPNMSENYGASRDPPEKQAPMCTLHSFPHNIDHCLTFARSEFEGLLEKPPAEANAFLSDPAKYLDDAVNAGDSAARERLERVAEVLVSDRCQSFADCVAWARRLFEVQFHDRIAQLVYTFPENAVTSTGAPFWSAPKRFPHPLSFDASDASQVTFIQAAAILKARTYCLQLPQWAFDLKQIASSAAAVHVPPFTPQQGVRIETDPKAASAAPGPRCGDDESQIAVLAQQLRDAQMSLGSGFKLEAIQFEKDDDTNFQMDFIAGLANMRARNYALQEVDKLKAKLIAGKIIPAIATATSLATGLVCLELYKVIQGKPIEAYRNTFANLALPLFSMAEPIPPKGVQYEGMKWTLWDRWVLDGDLTVQQVLDWFAERKLEAYSISHGQSLLYNNIFPKHRERLGKRLSDLVQSIGKADLSGPRNHFDIVVACEDEAGEDIDVPLISVKFK